MGRAKKIRSRKKKPDRFLQRSSGTLNLSGLYGLYPTMKSKKLTQPLP